MVVATDLCHSIFLSWKNCVLSRQTRVYHDKNMPIETKLLLRQNYSVCHDKHLSWQMFCRDRKYCVATNIILSWQNTSFVRTKVCLSRQKTLSKQTHVCRDRHTFVAAKPLSWQKLYLWQLPLLILHPGLFIQVPAHVPCYSHLVGGGAAAGRALGGGGGGGREILSFGPLRLRGGPPPPHVGNATTIDMHLLALNRISF